MALDNPWRSWCITVTNMKVSDRLFEVLRSTIVQVEETADLRADDPAIVELKSSIVRTVAELEIVKLQKSVPKDQ
jgi:hypothetical protein